MLNVNKVLPNGINKAAHATLVLDCVSITPRTPNYLYISRPKDVDGFSVLCTWLLQDNLESSMLLAFNKAWFSLRLLIELQICSSHRVSYIVPSELDGLLGVTKWDEQM